MEFIKLHSGNALSNAISEKIHTFNMQINCATSQLLSFEGD